MSAKKQVAKTRNYGFILYPDCDKHVELYNYFVSHYKYVCILHDKDVVNDSGELKKPHWHFVVLFPNPRSQSGVLKEYNDYDINHAEPISCLDSYIRYMVHDTADSKDKYQYDVSTLQGDSEAITKAFSKDENEFCVVGLKEILAFIDCMPFPSIKSVTEYVIDNQHLLPSFKKYNYLICRIVSECREVKK